MLAATVNASIVIISLPAIFRGIKLDPLTPGNVSYLLWMLMGYLLVSAVLVVTLGRLGDMFGRVRMYNAGFAIFTLGALALPFDPLTGPGGALWLIGFRVIQAIGGAMLMANSPAILTDAFPSDQRGMAMGINQVAGISGQFIGLILGGVLAAVDWRLVFIVSVPIGVIGTFWSYRSLREMGVRNRAKIDWLGNITFGVGLVGLLAGITYGIQPYGGHTMGWTSPLVLPGMIGGGGVGLPVCFFLLWVTPPPVCPKPVWVPGLGARGVAPPVAPRGRGRGRVMWFTLGERGVASGMLATFQNSGFVLSIGVFFSLMIAGLASTLPTTLTNGLAAHGVPHAIAHQVGQAPPVSSLFAAFLGYNPVHQLLAPTGVLAHLPAAQVGALTGRQFFPQLSSGPFHHRLAIAFCMAMAVLRIAAFACLLRGGRYVHEEQAAAAAAGAQPAARDRQSAGDSQPASSGSAQRAASGGWPEANPTQAALNGRQPRTDRSQPAGNGTQPGAARSQPAATGGQPRGPSTRGRGPQPGRAR